MRVGESNYSTLDQSNPYMEAAYNNLKKKYSIETPSIASDPVVSEPAVSESTGKGFGSSLGTPEMMAIGTGLQILGQYLDAPYKEMAAKQAMEMNRRDKQDAALVNLQNISRLYGNL